MKKLCIGLSFCVIIVCTVVGCTENISLSSSTDNSSDVPTQSVESPSQPTPTSTGEIQMNNSYKLIVNGKDITAGVYININFEHRYVELPFTAVMQALGAEVEWQNQTTAKVSYSGKNYFLDTTKCSFVEDGKSLNLMSTPPGGIRRHQVVGDEFVLDDGTMSGVFQLMGVSIRINRNFDEKIITIS